MNGKQKHNAVYLYKTKPKYVYMIVGLADATCGCHSIFLRTIVTWTVSSWDFWNKHNGEIQIQLQPVQAWSNSSSMIVQFCIQTDEKISRKLQKVEINP